MKKFIKTVAAFMVAILLLTMIRPILKIALWVVFIVMLVGFCFEAGRTAKRKPKV